MQVTTLSEARALVGRTFERDGSVLQVIGDDEPLIITFDGEYFEWHAILQLNEWLLKATEVTDGQ